MSWMERLYQTYEAASHIHDEVLLWPVSHVVKNAHIEVVIDDAGKFLKGRSRILEGDESPTLIPATESSAGRAGAKIAPHPLAEELGYCAGDLPKMKEEKFEAFMQQLSNWVEFDKANVKLQAIHSYLSRRCFWKDLSNEHEFPIRWKNRSGQSSKIEPEKTFVRWKVEQKGVTGGATWDDSSLIESWQGFDFYKNSVKGFCFVRGEEERISANHPRFIRHAGDGSKLVSSNDSNGFTYRGRLLEPNQVVEVSFDVTQKAHSALRWLINRQGYRVKDKDKGDRVYISWAVSCKPIPSPIETSWDLSADNLTYQEDGEQDLEHHHIDHTTNLGAVFANQINKIIAGYSAKLEPTDDIVVMGIDSATPGRMSVIYYRELIARDYLERLSRWHNQFAWYQRHKQEQSSNGKAKSKSKTIWPISSPAPRLIAEAAYGATLNDALKKSVLERIMPCIIDAAPFPKDLVDSAVRRVSNRVGYPSDESWRWEQDLGIVCALYRGYHQRHPKPQYRKEYSMSLEENNRSRDYLYGRLLAIAERIEEIALNVSGEGRSTTAARMMQRFADRPYSTWRNLELALQPYMQRLQVARQPFLNKRKDDMDSVLSAFASEDFTSDRPLSGEFLLAYHCQRLQLRNRTESNDPNKESN